MTNLIRFNRRRNDMIPGSWVHFLDEVFDDGTNNHSQAKSWKPSVNILSTEDSFDIQFSAPGMKKEDFKVEVDQNVLTVSTEITDSKEDTTDSYTLREFSTSSFSRSFTLPKNVDSETIKAEYKDGILNLTVPKVAEVKTTKSIAVG